MCPGPEGASGIGGGGGELEEGDGGGDAVVVFPAVAIDAADELVDGAGGGELEGVTGLPAEGGPGGFAVGEEAEPGGVGGVLGGGVDVEEAVLCEGEGVLEAGGGGDDAGEEPGGLGL